MTSLETMARIAARYDTAMSWAMLRELSCLGVAVRWPATRAHERDHARAYEVRYEDLMECFRNESSPMDLRISSLPRPCHERLPWQHA